MVSTKKKKPHPHNVEIIENVPRSLLINISSTVRIGVNVFACSRALWRACIRMFFFTLHTPTDLVHYYSVDFCRKEIAKTFRRVNAFYPLYARAFCPLSQLFICFTSFVVVAALLCF